jgi:hypothetical protein
MLSELHYLPVLTPDSDRVDLEAARDKLINVYTKNFAISHANQKFILLTSRRKEKVVRALFLGDLAIERMWEVEGVLHYKVMSFTYFRELEFTKLYGIEPVRKYTKYYTVIYNPWTMKWFCDCEYYSMYTDIDDCTHIVEVKLMNILKEYIPYFIYAYRFLLPHRCYKHFMATFTHRNIE